MLNLKYLVGSYDLSGFFRNDEKEIHPYKLKPKSTFNLRNKDDEIEIY